MKREKNVFVLTKTQYNFHFIKKIFIINKYFLLTGAKKFIENNK